jgi:hypothetical protein
MGATAGGAADAGGVVVAADAVAVGAVTKLGGGRRARTA